ncbi:MAG: hypothetical protein F6J87_30185 [Spirulina sp. SIO3F2]|nr:hypothetical protein [Spirulina sp. SIO3F2]
MTSLLEQAIYRRKTQPETPLDPTTFPPIKLTSPQSKIEASFDPEQCLQNCAVGLIECLEQHNRAYVLHLEPAQIWHDEEEGETTSSPAAVLVLRGQFEVRIISFISWLLGGVR